ncbi:hypothetical protein ACVWYF_003520 [Hymenobacter sp. UYAg731]
MTKYIILALFAIPFKSFASGVPKVAELPATILMDLQLGQRATAMTRVLIGQLNLNEGEYIRLRALHQILLASLDGINAQYVGTPEVKRAKLQELQGQYEQERLRVLSPSQVSHLQSQPASNSVPTIDLNSGGLG